MSEADTQAKPAAIEGIVDRYIQMRDKKAELKAKFDAETAKLDEGMEKCERFMLNHMNNTGVESVGTKAGTVFKSKVTSATVADWDATLAFIRAEGMWNLLDKRVNKTAVVEFREQKDDLPPGINWREETVVRFRRT